jgi:molybdopterin molybdotransferase
LLSVYEARQLLLANLPICSTEEISTDYALGRILVDDIVAPDNYPPFDYSSMDGFAVRSGDLINCSQIAPVDLVVTEDIPAGKVPTREIKSGETARIMTGGVIPAGADAVVPIEATNLNWRESYQAELPEQVKIYTRVHPGEYVRRTAEDFSKGQIVIPKKVLRSQEIGFLGMLGIPRVLVHKKPHVGIMASGDELTQLGKPLLPGKIYDSNSLTISALLTKYGADPLQFGIAGDNISEIKDVLDNAVTSQVDLIISSAGVSVGAFDFIKNVVSEGGELTFWRVNMRPGKPFAFGNYKGVPFIGLPGNPVSAFVGCEVFVYSAVRKMAGASELDHPALRVETTHEITNDGRESYLRAHIFRRAGKWMAGLTGHQGSGNLHSLVLANALLIVPSGVKSLPAGATLDAWLLE